MVSECPPTAPPPDVILDINQSITSTQLGIYCLFWDHKICWSEICANKRLNVVPNKVATQSARTLYKPRRQNCQSKNIKKEALKHNARALVAWKTEKTPTTTKPSRAFRAFRAFTPRGTGGVYCEGTAGEIRGPHGASRGLSVLNPEDFHSVTRVTSHLAPSDRNVSVLAR